MADTAATLQAKADKFVADRHGKLNARQAASLAKLQKRIDAARAAEAAEGTDAPADTPTYIQAVGPDPLPNNNRGQTPGQSYDCPDDAEAVAAQHGYSWEWAFNDQLTKLLRPTEDTPAAASRQAIALRFVRGEAPFEEYRSIIGGNAKYLGCIVIADIHDLGA
jgi:hypothetical protein